MDNSAATETMRAVVVDREAPGRLTLASVARPVPGPGESLIRVKAFSLNRGETRTAIADAASGWRPGWDVSGIVERPAIDGSGPPAGAGVVGLAQAGWAELVALPAERLAVLPQGVAFATASTLPVAGLTARAALTKGGDIQGKKILITGASGGVGTFALQLARRAGAVVTAAIRTAAQEEVVRRLGASNVAVGPTPQAAASFGPFDLILESVGGASLAAALEMLAPDATCVLFGASARARSDFNASKFRVGGTSLYGLVLGHELRRSPPSAGLAELGRQVAEGSLVPHIEREAPWADIAAVAQDLIDRRFTGKAVLHIA